MTPSGLCFIIKSTEKQGFYGQNSFKIFKELYKKHTYGTGADYTLQSLFYAYETQTINSLDGLFVATQEFVQFLYYNKAKILKKINKAGTHNQDYFDIEYDRIMLAFSHIADDNQLFEQSKFIKVAELFNNDPNARLLDVGAGGIPLTSLLFTTDYDNVSSMDKFLLSNEFLRAQNITPYNQYFTTKTDVSSFDYIVGRRPCSAIPSVVKNCTKENKPYFMELCGCHLEHITLDDGSHPNSWEEVLPNYDPNIKFVDGYAFNIDASKSQVHKMIEHCHPEIFDRNNPLAHSFLAMSFLIDCFNEIEQEIMMGLE